MPTLGERTVFHHVCNETARYINENRYHEVDQCCDQCSADCLACMRERLLYDDLCGCDDCVYAYRNNGYAPARCIYRSLNILANNSVDNPAGYHEGDENMPRSIEMPYARTFGIEIECNNGEWSNTMDLADAIAQQLTRDTGRSVFVESEDEEGNLSLVMLNNGWGVCYDGSCGFEVKSPLLSGQRGINDVAAMLKAMNAIGCETNSACGIHVHVDTRDIRSDAGKLANLASMIAHTEDMFFGVVNRMRHGNNYCRFFHNDTLAAMASSHSIEDVMMSWYHGRRTMSAADREYYLRDVYNFRTNHYHSSRYFGANLHSVFYRGSVEFRYFNSTVSKPRLVQSWIVMCVAVVEYAARARRVRFPARAYIRYGNTTMPKRFARLLRVFARGNVLGAFPVSAAQVLARRMSLRTGITVNNPLA